MPGLKLVLQTGGHAYHVDVEAAKKRGVAIALGRRIKAPLASVPELTFALILGLIHKVYAGERMMQRLPLSALLGTSDVVSIHLTKRHW